MSTYQINSDRLALTVPAACEAASLGRTMVYKAITTGELASIKVGKRRLVLRDDLLDWLRRQRT